MNTLKLLGTGLLKKDKTTKTTLKVEKKAQRVKKEIRTAAVEAFLREILGTHLVKIEKKYF